MFLIYDWLEFDILLRQNVVQKSPEFISNPANFLANNSASYSCQRSQHCRHLICVTVVTSGTYMSHLQRVSSSPLV
jgi:hypothetical protein